LNDDDYEDDENDGVGGEDEDCFLPPLLLNVERHIVLALQRKKGSHQHYCPPE